MLDSKEICDSRAFCRLSGKGFFRVFARCSKELICWCVKKDFAGAEVSKTSDNIDTTASLGCSEVFSVKHSPRNAIPELVQCL